MIRIFPIAVGTYLQCLCGNASRRHDCFRCAAALARADWALSVNVKLVRCRGFVVDASGAIRRLGRRATGERFEEVNPETGQVRRYKVMKPDKPKKGEVRLRGFQLRSFNAKARLAGLEPIPHVKTPKH